MFEVGFEWVWCDFGFVYDLLCGVLLLVGVVCCGFVFAVVCWRSVAFLVINSVVRACSGEFW